MSDLLKQNIDLNKGYNPTMNLITLKLLKELDDNDEQMFRKELKKENPKAYKEFLEFEKKFR